MSEISVKIEHKKPALSDEEIAAKLATQRAAIPGDVDRTIDEFLKVTNPTAIKRFVQVIDAFPNPEEGLKLWKEYYATGNDKVLKESLLKQRLPFSITLAQLREAMRDEERLGEAKPGVVRTIKKEIRMLFGRVALSILAPKINHIDTNTEIVFETFLGARRRVFNPNKDGSALEDVLHTQLKEAVEAKMVSVPLSVLRFNAAFDGATSAAADLAASRGITSSSLDELKAVEDKQGLLPREVVLAARDQIIQKRLDLFDTLASQSFGSQADDCREATELSCHQIPKGQRFGIECEGFFPSDAEMMKQSMELWSALNDKQYKALGMDVRFPLMSLLPKNDDKYSKWSITMDSSVINPLRFVVQQGKKSRGFEKLNNVGLEIVSAILEGPMGGLQALVVTETLKAMGFRSNKTCGFHIHVDLSDAPLEELKNLAKAFVKNESRIDSFVDTERRGEKGVFAKSVAAVNPTDIDAAKNVHELLEVMNQGDRNSKFDITNLGVPGAPPTVQYRGEGGAGYINNAVGYTVLMVNFTRMARKNPDITIDDVLTKLRNENAPKPSEPTAQTSDPKFPIAAAG